MWIALIILSIFSVCDGMIRDISFEVVENCPIGTVIGNIKIAAELFPFKYVELSLENGDHFDDFSKDQKSVKSIFKIDIKTSNLITTKEIDREALCLTSSLKVNETCSILQIVSVNKLMWINLNIIIIDVNDNSPTFREKNITITLSEITKMHSTIQLENASDLDSVKYAPLTYTLKMTNNYIVPFQLQNNPLKLLLLKTLDYEDIRHYTMIIIACDAGSPKLCGNQTLNVEVINENDEAPVFLRSNYTAIINEDASIGQVVLQPKAFDRDAGEYGKVKYSISSGYDLVKKYFSINEDNGNIIIKEKFHNPTKLKFSIEANDDAPNPLIGRTWIFLHIVDVNNNHPMIQVNSIDSIIIKKSVNYTIVEVTENNKVPLNLAFITVRDADQGENSRCTCNFISDDSKIQLINVNEISERNIYRLISKLIFDAESQTRIKIKIFCNDHGEPQNNVTHEIEVRVKDVNEYPPSFDQSLYEIEISENVSIGTNVKHIKVYDRDVRYVISLDLTDPGLSYFEINSSGHLSTKALFDYEKLKKMEFYVVAVDRGINAFTSSVKVSVFILDINDNAPEFFPNSNNFEIYENVQGIYKIGKVIAFDKDSTINSQLNFFLLNTSNESHKNIDTLKLFFINQKTGDIHSNVSLDYENCTMYILLVKVIDNGKPSLSNVQTCYVHVKDVNDHGPQWQYPNTHDNVLNISVVNIRDSILTRVRAVDLDGDKFNTVNYYLRSHNDILHIDKITGVITLRINIQESRKLSILINAVDANSKEKQSSQLFTINIHYDYRPFLGISSFSLTFPVLISIIGISSLISIILVIILFFFCCRKRRICRTCVNSCELLDTKYERTEIKTLNQLPKVVDIPLDLVTDNDNCNNSIVEDSVKLIFSSIHSTCNPRHLDGMQNYDRLDPTDHDLFIQRNSKDPNQTESDYYGLSSALLNLTSSYNANNERCTFHSSSDEDSSRYLEHIDPLKTRSTQKFQNLDSTDCMINSYATFVKCGCALAPNKVAATNPSLNKSITAPFIFNGSAWIPTESMLNENFVIQTQRDSVMQPLKSIMKKTATSFMNVDNSSSSGHCNETDQTSSAYDSGCILGNCDQFKPPSKPVKDKTYQCKKSQV